MRRLSKIISYVPVLLIAIALASTAADWRLLVETGGAFALLGHFLMVAATLVLLYLAAVLVLILAALPLVYLFCRNENNFLALDAARPFTSGANALLKAAWYSWWYVRGRLVHERSR